MLINVCELVNSVDLITKLVYSVGSCNNAMVLGAICVQSSVLDIRRQLTFGSGLSDPLKSNKLSIKCMSLL